MKTDDLIAAMAADTQPARFGLAAGWWLAVAIAALAAAAAFLIMLVPRPDIALVVSSARFLFKFLFAGSLAGAAFVSVRALSRPGVSVRAALPLLVPPVLLAIAVGLELISAPAAEWTTRLVGKNSMACLFFIPTIGMLPLAAFIVALRRGAPSHPVLAGAVCGLLSGGVAALFYATHCLDDSPLFVATWYSIAVVVLAVLGGLAGKLFVRW